MEAKHTPGPWEAEDREERFAIHAKSPHTGESFELASVQLDDADDQVGGDSLEANAKLIAASPRMAGALQRCDDAFAGWQVGQIPGRPEDILALITEVRAALTEAGLRP